jgi:hypothetical protein
VLNGTCSAARPLSDGQVLRNQDLSEGRSARPAAACPRAGQALFYSVTLLPQQQLSVTLLGARPADRGTASAGKMPLFMALHGGCSQCDCRGASQGIAWTTPTPPAATQKLILEISTMPGCRPQSST